MSHLDPPIAKCDKEVQRITHLQKITSHLPVAFTDTVKVTKSYIPIANMIGMNHACISVEISVYFIAKMHDSQSFSLILR